MAKKLKSQYGTIAKEFISFYYKKRYEELFGFLPRIEWGKDLSLLIKLCNQYDNFAIQKGIIISKFLELYCEKYFQLKNGLAKKSGYSIGIFYKIISTLIIEQKEKEQIKELNSFDFKEGFRLAFLNYFEEDYNKDITIGNESIFLEINKFLLDMRQKNKILETIDFIRLIELFFIFVFNKIKLRSNFKFEFVQFNKMFIFFEQWIENEGQEILPFLPKKITYKKPDIPLETKISIMEDFVLLYLELKDKYEFTLWLQTYPNNKQEQLYKELKLKIINMNLSLEFSSLNSWF